jgi:hypothetical protein
MTDDLPFKVARSNGIDDVLARDEPADRSRRLSRRRALYPDELIELRQGRARGVICVGRYVRGARPPAITTDAPRAA